MFKLFLYLCFLILALPALAQPKIKKPIRLTLKKNGLPHTAKKLPANASDLVFEYCYKDPNHKPDIVSVGVDSPLIITAPYIKYAEETHQAFLDEAKKAYNMVILDISCPKGSAPKRQTYEVLKGLQEAGKLDSLKSIYFIELDENFEEMPQVFDILAGLPCLRYAHFSGKSAESFAEQFLKLQQMEEISLSYDSYASCLPKVLSLPKLKELRLDYAPELETMKFLEKAEHLESITVQIYKNHTPNPEKASQYLEQLQKKLPNTQIYFY